MAVESTLAIVKPDAFASADTIVDELTARGFTVAERETLTLSAARASDFYREHEERPFFGALVAFMTSGPIVALVLRKQAAIADLRAALGPTDASAAKKTAPDSIRAKFGTDVTKNAVHGSDSPAAAAREIAFFFPNHSVGGITSGKAAKDYLNAEVAPVLTKALQEMCIVAPADPVEWLGRYLLATKAPAQIAESKAESSIASLQTPIAPKQEKKPKIYFVLGNAGSGKGTQCARLVDKFGFAHISAGDLLREEVRSKSPDGEMIDDLIKNGKIVPGNVTLKLLAQAIDKNSDKPGILVDGFPRALGQAGGFEKEVSDFEFCLFFDCPEEVLMERILKRAETSGRADDNVHSLRKRFQTFKDTCYPVVEYYEAKGKVRRIDADRSVDSVSEEVSSLF
jgi:UMP-CMP kinase